MEVIVSLGPAEFIGSSSCHHMSSLLKSYHFNLIFFVSNSKTPKYQSLQVIYQLFITLNQCLPVNIVNEI